VADNHDMTKVDDHLVPLCIGALAIIVLFIFSVLDAP
jgi:hypothetical protein